jgi:hypothetical protein
VRQRLHLGIPAVGHVESLQPTLRGGGGVGRAEPVQSTQIFDLVADEHARVKPALLGHVTEPATLGLADGRTVPPHRAGIEFSETEDGPHRRRLARPVGPEETDDLSSRDIEGQVVQGGDGPVCPAQPYQL